MPPSNSHPDEEPVRLPVIARSEELDAIRWFLTQVPDRGSILVLEGDPGIGKTTLWRHAVESARSASYQLLCARPGETESKPSNGGLIDLFGDSLKQLLGELPASQASTLETALLHRPGKVEQPGAVAIAVLSALRALAAHGPVVVAVDDFQWLDRPSKRVLLYVARRLGDEAIGIVATERPPTALVGLPEERLTRVRIGPLSLAGLHHLVRDRLHVSLERPRLVRVAHASGGNPMYALEIARSLNQTGFSGGFGAALPIPASLRVLVRRRLAQLQPAAREAVVATYGLWHPTPELVELALELAGQPQEGLSLAVEAEALELASARVILAHPLLGSVLYERLAPSARRALHARLAGLPLDPVEHAYQLLLAAHGPDPGAAQIAETTAATASARGAPETAAGLLELAVRLTPTLDDDSRIRRLDRLALAHFLAGDSAQAVTLWTEVARAAPAGPRRAHAIWRLAEFGSATVFGAFERVPDMLEAVIDEAGADSTLHADIESSLAEHLLWGRGPLAAEPHARAALRLAQKTPDRRTLAHALISQALTDFFLGRGIPNALLERAIELEAEGLEVQTEILPTAYRAFLCASVDDALVPSAALLDEKLEQAARDHDESSLPVLLWWRCEVAVASGELGAASLYAARSRDAVEASGRTGRLGGAVYCQALVEAHRGHSDEALALARRALELDEPRGVHYLIAQYRGVLGFVELSSGRPHQALEWLEPTYRLLREQGYGEPAHFRFVPDLVEALTLLGRFDDAEAALAPYQDAAQRLGRRSALASAGRARGLLLAASGELDAASAELDRAVRLEQELGRPFGLARAELARGAVARRGRHRSTARQALQRALQLFEAVGSPIWAGRAREELAHAAARVPAAFELTPTQRHIAELVASGCSNPEIATKLFMSRKTVERHLTLAYQRLGVRSRAELAALVSAMGYAPPVV